MKKILSLIVGILFTVSIAQAEEKLNIEKQLVGIVGAISGTVKTETRELKVGDNLVSKMQAYVVVRDGVVEAIEQN